MVISNEGHIVEGLLTGGNVHDSVVADDLTEDIYGCYVLEDMGYDSDSHRIKLRANNNIPVIPGRKNRIVPISYDKEMYKLRSKIEIFFGRLKENKRLAMRYDKSDQSFLGFIALGAIKVFLGLIIS